MTLSLLVLAGCDGVFGLTRLPERSPDAPAADVLITDALTCWAPQQISYDSDNDGFPDGCDNCPGDFNTSQADGDDDGVGDVCDPHRAQAGDHLAFFDGFQERDNLWRGRGTSFEWLHEPGVDGAWKQTRVGSTTNAQLIYDREFRSPTVIVTHEGQINNTTLTFGAVFVWIVDGPNTPPDGVGGGTRSMDGDLNGVSFEIKNNMTISQFNSVQSLAMQEPARVMALPNGDVFARRGGGLDVTSSVTPTVMPATSKIALHVYATSIRFTSVTVIETY